MAFTTIASPARFNKVEKVTSADDGNTLDPNFGFYVDQAGTFSFLPRGNAAAVAMAVEAGEFYEIDVEEVDFAGSTTTSAAFLLRKVAT